MGAHNFCYSSPQILAPHACPPPILPGIARIPRTPPGLASPAVRATEARPSPFQSSYPRAFLARSLALTAHAARSALSRPFAGRSARLMALGRRALRPQARPLVRAPICHACTPPGGPHCPLSCTFTRPLPLAPLTARLRLLQGSSLQPFELRASFKVLSSSPNQAARAGWRFRGCWWTGDVPILRSLRVCTWICHMGPEKVCRPRLSTVSSIMCVGWSGCFPSLCCMLNCTCNAGNTPRTTRRDRNVRVVT